MDLSEPGIGQDLGFEPSALALALPSAQWAGSKWGLSQAERAHMSFWACGPNDNPCCPLATNICMQEDPSTFHGNQRPTFVGTGKLPLEQDHQHHYSKPLYMYDLTGVANSYTSKSYIAQPLDR